MQGKDQQIEATVLKQSDDLHCHAAEQLLMNYWVIPRRILRPTPRFS